MGIRLDLIARATGRELAPALVPTPLVLDELVEARELTMQEVLGDRFIVIPVKATRRLQQVWGRSPSIDEAASSMEGVWWPTGVWTSRRRPDDGQTPPRGMRIVLRHASVVLPEAASYDIQEVGDFTWVLAMDKDDDPIGVWCLAHEVAEKFLKAFTVPRWTPAGA